MTTNGLTADASARAFDRQIDFAADSILTSSSLQVGDSNLRNKARAMRRAIFCFKFHLL